MISLLASFSSFLAPTMAASAGERLIGFVSPLSRFSPGAFGSFAAADFGGMVAVACYVVFLEEGTLLYYCSKGYGQGEGRERGGGLLLPVRGKGREGGSGDDR